MYASALTSSRPLARRVRAGITENDLSIKLKVGSKQLKKGHPVDVVIQPPKRRIEDQDSAQKMIVEVCLVCSSCAFPCVSCTDVCIDGGDSIRRWCTRSL